MFSNTWNDGRWDSCWRTDMEEAKRCQWCRVPFEDLSYNGCCSRHCADEKAEEDAMRDARKAVAPVIVGSGGVVVKIPKLKK